MQSNDSKSYDGAVVVVRDANKSFKAGHPVLNGLNMTVPNGSIYSLIGSSGCGKSTLLSCILAQRSLDSGCIWVFGREPGTKSTGVPGRNVGYMPQDISLYEEFSIRETFNYFGILTGVGKDEMKKRMQNLMKLLHLSKQNRQIFTLSGGEKRRVSFAVALFHNPKLLILDEPTVGVDPLIRQNIWFHLQKLVSSKQTTVIITTHYIEECRQADMIGIMRNGNLLAESSPENLCTKFGSTNLESIVLSLSRQKINNNIQYLLNESTSSTSTKHVPSFFYEKNVTMDQVADYSESAFWNSLIRIRALVDKNIVQLLRNPVLLLFLLLLSGLLHMITCCSLGPDPLRMPLGLVNDEVSHISVCSNISRIPNECNVDYLSCHFLTSIPEDKLRLNTFYSEEDAVKGVQQGNILGFIIFPKNFSTSLYSRFMFGANSDDLTLNSSKIFVRLDETNKLLVSAIKKTLYDAYFNFTKTLLINCGSDARLGDSSLTYRQPIFGKSGTSFLEFLAPGVIPSFLFFFSLITCSIRYIREKKSGVLDRSLVTGVKTWEIMFAYSITESFLLICQAILNYCVNTIIFHISVVGSDYLVILLYILGGYGGVAMGFLLGSVCTEEIQAAMLAMAALFPNFLLSGILWPIEGMPTWLQYIAHVLPFTLSGESVRSVTSRGWEFAHPNVWPGFVTLMAYIIVCFMLTLLFHKVLKR